MEVSSAKKKSSSTSGQEGQTSRGQNIQVFVRVRPLNQSEKHQRSCSIVDTQGTKEVVIKDKQSTLSATTKTFGFDRVFGPASKQVDVHKAVVGPLIKQVLQGYNCTVFAYGQTGTGKTYTMEGLGEIRGAWDNDPNAGIIPRALSDLFDGLRMIDAVEYSIRVSFLELYNEEIFDLLSGADDQSKLRLYEDGQKRGSVIIQGLEDVQVHDKREVFKILEKGSIKRQTAETKMNATSSRSHTIFTVTVYINQQSLEGEDMLRVGKLNLVDLAGSENIGRSGAINQRAREAGNINQSLLTLGRVITSLVDRTPHIPYRESKLTRLLQDSLGGRTKTSIIATISPASINHEETLSTLDYAHRAKNITNKPEVNQKISKKEKLLEYHHEIDKLKQELLAAREKDGVFLPKETYEEHIKTKQRQEEEIVALTKELKAKETEMENFLEMFNDTKARLDSTTEERDKTIRALDCTRIVLNKTEHDKKREEYLKLKHQETERKLSKQAHTLLEVSELSTKDLSKVHDKIERQKDIQDSNDKVKMKLVSAVQEHHGSIENAITESVKNEMAKIKEVEASLGENTKLRNESVCNLSSEYEATLLKLVETIDNIKGIASTNTDAEREWLSEISSVACSESEMRSNDFQDYLVNTLLRSANEILDSVTKQNNKIANLSYKIDVSVKEMENKLNNFMEDHKNKQMAHQMEIDKLFLEIQRLNDIKMQNIELNRKAAHAHRTKQDNCIQTIKQLLEEHDKCEEAYEKERMHLYESTVEASGGQSVLMNKVKELRIEENKNANIMNEKYQSEEMSMLHKVTEHSSKCVEIVTEGSKIVVDSIKQLKKDSEGFVEEAKANWDRHMKNMQKESSSRRENSEKCLNEIEAKQKESEESTTTSKQKVSSYLIREQEAENKNLISLNSKLSKISRDQKKFEEQAISEIDKFNAFATNLISDLKKDVPSGTTPRRMDRKFPQKIIEGTPDDIRIKSFQSSIDASCSKLPKTLDMEAMEGEDSVFSSPTISCENGTNSIDHETGYGSDEEKYSIKSDKENSNPNPNMKEKNKRGRDFVKPKVSKLKQVNNFDSQPNSRKGSRSGSRTRREIRS